MTELYPVLEDGDVQRVFGGSAEATVFYNLPGYEVNLALYWVEPEEGVDVKRFLDRRGDLRVEDTMVPYGSWVLSASYVHAYTFERLEEHVERLVRLVGRELRGRRVLLAFSGGKDSLAALLTLLRLQERVSFKLDVMYVHIPYLEPERNLRFVETVARRLSIEIEVVEAPRKKFRSYLLWRGLPRRGERWCTFFKVKPMRDYKKKFRGSLEVVADRITESPKRLEKLWYAASAHEYLSGRKFRPTYLMTLLDVIKIVRESGLIHPAYLDGLPRVACTYCPFKALHEFTVREDVEDPGVIETVLRKEHKRWYSEIPYEDFVKHHLWRYSRKEALQVYRVKQVLEKLVEREGLEKVKAETVNNYYRALWVKPLPKAPVLNPPDVAAKVMSGGFVKPRGQL